MKHQLSVDSAELVALLVARCGAITAHLQACRSESNLDLDGMGTIIARLGELHTALADLVKQEGKKAA